MFSAWFMPRGYTLGKVWGIVDSSVHESVKRRLEPDADELPLLEPLPGIV